MYGSVNIVVISAKVDPNYTDVLKYLENPHYTGKLALPLTIIASKCSQEDKKANNLQFVIFKLFLFYFRF